MNNTAHITIVETLARPGKGIIACGTDADLSDWTTDQIRAIVGEEVVIQGERVRVLGVEVSAALSGRRNIFLLLPEATPLEALTFGTRIDLHLPV